MGCVQADMNGLSLDISAALLLMREGGVSGWPAAQMLVAIRTGMAQASIKKEATDGAGTA
jgi:hypothetical protein